MHNYVPLCIVCIIFSFIDILSILSHLHVLMWSLWYAHEASSYNNEKIEAKRNVVAKQ